MDIRITRPPVYESELPKPKGCDFIGNPIVSRNNEIVVITASTKNYENDFDSNETLVLEPYKALVLVYKLVYGGYELIKTIRPTKQERDRFGAVLYLTDNGDTLCIGSYWDVSPDNETEERCIGSGCSLTIYDIFVNEKKVVLKGRAEETFVNNDFQDEQLDFTKWDMEYNPFDGSVKFIRATDPYGISVSSKPLSTTDHLQVI